MANAKSVKRKRVPISEEEKARRDHIKRIRATFANAGFQRFSDLADKAFQFGTISSDFDDVFIYENVIVLAEYTAKKHSIGDHLKSKKLVYDSVLDNKASFLNLLSSMSPSFKEKTGLYHSSKLIVRVIYASLYDFDAVHKANVGGPIYMDYPAVRYFENTSSSIRKSCLPELFEFLTIDADKVGKNGNFSSGFHSVTYRAQILPEAHSNFDEGFKIVSFYADPQALLERSYVLRRNGWRDSQNLYQRMVIKSKIDAIRKYLHEQKRVFVNNIIVTLPADTRILNASGSQVDASRIIETQVVNIQLPARRESIGIIDGQHRIFSYHEAIDDDLTIARLRGQQNLLVTGLVYPQSYTEREREKFEARLFLEINSTQTGAKDDLKNSINLHLEPFSAPSVATRVMEQLASRGPLAGAIERYFFEDNRIKTTSIVKYGLVPLVRIDGDQSLIRHWTDVRRDAVVAKNDESALQDYIKFCADHISLFFSAAKSNVPAARWTSDKKVSGFLLSTTSINSFLACLRAVGRDGDLLSYDVYKRRLAMVEAFAFSAFKSSQYVRAGEQMYETYIVQRTSL